MRIILLGAPGCGKGTQANVICKEYNVPHISTGDIFRHHMSVLTPIGKIAKSFIDKGELVPDEVTVEMVKERLSHKDCSEGFVLDGFPRTVAQAEALKDISDIDYVLDIDIDEGRLLKRLTGRRSCVDCGTPYHISRIKEGEKCAVCGGELIQRDDDKEETVSKRLKVYKEKTMPLIEYYNKKKILRKVDGDGDEQEVFERIKRLIDKV